MLCCTCEVNEFMLHCTINGSDRLTQLMGLAFILR